MILNRSLRKALYATSAVVTSMAAFAPAYANDAPLSLDVPVVTAAVSDAGAEATSRDDIVVTDRLVAMSTKGGKGGIIRPFAGGIMPNAGNIRTFAGSVFGSAGNIRTFSGDTTASAGNIRTFAGNIRTFAGNIRTFNFEVLTANGPDSTFWGTSYPSSGTITASAGNIRTFAGEFESMAGNIRTFAGNIRTFDGQLLTYSAGGSTYRDLNASIAALVAGSKASWGAAVTARTGKTFEQAFANPMLQKYGIDLNNAQSLVGLDEVGFELFLLDWNDNLMNYSGVDQVDHWMKAINWTPRITQDLGSGKDSRIGLLDFTVTGDETSNIVRAGGYNNATGSHGSAVVSLMVAGHNGRGVMGIAPGASVVAYNPFDSTNTAGWSDIKAGVIDLVKNGATIINMSLGVPGFALNPGWNDVFSDKAVSDEARKRVFVLAAGNEGLTQTTDVKWDFSKNPYFIVVGSVDPFGKISDFSNRPGKTCLLGAGKSDDDEGGCGSASHGLMNRFVVAPGEFILVSDGKGGVTRMSGTSFAAPLVSGTVALIHDRWPWLRDKPSDTVDLILRSAKDLGAKGTDPVYGRGMLDVQAALSPENLATLKYKVSVNGGGLKDLQVNSLSESARAAMVKTWETSSAYLTVFDDTLNSYRDFAIPLSNKLVGQTVGKSAEQFASYLTSRFYAWFNAGGTTTTSGGKGDFRGFTDNRMNAQVGKFGELEVTMSAAPRPYRPGLRNTDTSPETGFSVRSPGQGVGLRFGTGRGAAALGQGGFGLESDYDTQVGGANPFLGFASGAGYAAVDVEIARGLTLSTGVSMQNAQRDFDRMAPDERTSLGGTDPYKATANVLTMKYQVASFLSTTASYTLLDEKTGLLGVQSLDRNDMRGGSLTDAGTFGADVSVTPGLMLSASATVGRTRAGDTSRQSIAVGRSGAMSTAFQMGVTKLGLFGNDRARFTLSQPLHLEAGSIDVSNVQVVDRQTGELGNVVTTYQLEGQKRRLVGELLYGRSLMDGTANLNLFGRANLNAGAELNQPSLTMGGSFSLRF